MRPHTLASLTLFALCFTAPRVAWSDPPSLLDRLVVRAATERAIERAGLDPGVTRALASRARNAAWLPQLSVRVARNTGASTTQYTAVTADRQALDDSLFVDVRVSFSFDRLVFDPRETTLWRLEAQRAERRAHLEAAVLDALARCEQLRRAAAQRPEGSAPDVSWEFEWARARARVEQLTGAPIESLTAP
jgi:hypothetical protein